MNKTIKKAVNEINAGKSIRAAARDNKLTYSTLYRYYQEFRTGTDPDSEIKVRGLKSKLKDAERKLTFALEDLMQERTRNEILNSIPKIKQPPRWLTQKISGKQDRAIANAMLSDTHFDEVVNPSEISGVNAYNRIIAEERLEDFFSNVEKLCKNYCGGIKLDGLTLALGGDMVSGDIHEELASSNEASTIATVLHFYPLVAAGIEHLADSLGIQVYVPAVVGNHGRKTKKPRNKGRVEDNFDYLLARLVAESLNHRDDITVGVATGPDISFNEYSTRYLLTHGDQFSGGSGIGGIYPALMRGIHK